jgi:hypothetical protein
MMDQLPAGRPVTNFLWRYLPDAGGRAESIVRIVAWLLLVTAAVMYASRFLPVGMGRPVLDPAHTVYWDDEITAGLFVGFFFLMLANFLKRRTYVNARLRAGLSFAEANRPPDQSGPPASRRHLAQEPAGRRRTKET